MRRVSGVAALSSVIGGDVEQGAGWEGEVWWLLWTDGGAGMG